MQMRMNEIVKTIRKNGSVELQFDEEIVAVGFMNSDCDGKLIMLGGGYYVITHKDGRKFNIGKGQLVTVV